MAGTDATLFVIDSGSSIAVVGLGVVGGRVARQLASSGHRVVVFDRQHDRARRIAEVSNIQHVRDPGSLDPGITPVVVLATGDPQRPWAEILVESGHHVVATSDDIDDVRDLVELDETARRRQRTVIVGAAASPGLTGLLVAELASRVDAVDEIHVAFHGTGGPACARQHHLALAGEAWGWHDGEWIRRPGGSGRDLLWFPEPIGGKDCYRAALADPILLHDIFPSASRISARMSANRRDRFTSRLPMLSPPHPEGGIGGVRVEVRGSRHGERRTEVAGVAERTGIIAAAVAAA
ncbi:MAG: NAD(P)-binding domain-containing protein, partial [Actinomycetota bacterium]